MKNLRKCWSQRFTTKGSAELSAAPGGILRLRISPAAAPRDFTQYAITAVPKLRGSVSCAAKPKGAVTAATGPLRLTVASASSPGRMAVRLCDPDGSVLIQSAPGAAAVIKGETNALRLRLAPGTQFYGLGEFGESFTRVPGRFVCWNADDPAHQPLKKPYCAIPFAVVVAPSGQAFGLFVNNPGRVVFDLGMQDPEVATITTDTGDLDLWMIAGPKPADVIELWTRLTGRITRPPMWALGLQQSRYSYMDEAEVREIAGEFRRRRIPCDVIYYDIHYMDGYRVFTWNPAAFPNPRKLNADLRRKGFQVVTSVDPGLKIDPAYAPYRQGVKGGYFLARPDGKPVESRVWPGLTHHPDFTSPKVRQWWGKLQHEHLIRNGVRGVWCDMNEPAIMGAVFVDEYPPEAIHEDGGCGRTHGEVHNIYGQTMVQAAREGLVRHRPAERPFVLSRSGWAGLQKHAAIWTGDNRSCWGSMPLDLAQLLSLGMSGVPFAGCDIGGFQNNTTPELFIRWLEWGIFSPLCRLHTELNSRRQEPWSFGPGAEALARELIGLRMRLLPYLYAQFAAAENTGTPIMRPLMLQYPGDPACAAIGDQFFVGPDLLVAPVLEAGRDRRMVYLPPGEWVHLWTGAVREGASWLIEDAPLGWPPVYVRSGAIIPMAPLRQHTGEPCDSVSLEIYPAASMGGVLVEDDGISFKYRDGGECVRAFAGVRTPEGMLISVSDPEGAYRPARRWLNFRLHIAPASVARVEADGKPVKVSREGAAVSWRVRDNRRAIEFSIALR